MVATSHSFVSFFYSTRVIAAFTLLEAWRNRLFWLIAVFIAAGLGMSAFLHSVTLTESDQIQVALLAALLRVCAVFVVTSFVVTSMVREANDKGSELILAFALPRASYFFGKLAGFLLVALGTACLMGLPLGLYASWGRVAVWTMSLACELA